MLCASTRRADNPEGAVDRRLVEQAQRGDEDAFEALVRATGDRCVGIAYRILRDVDLAEDAVQTAYVSAWRDLRSLRDPDRFEPWLHRTLTRACYEEARKSRRYAANIRALPTESSFASDDVHAVVDRDQLDRGIREKIFKASAGFDLAHVEFHVVRWADVSSDFREIAVKMPSAGIADGGNACV